MKTKLALDKNEKTFELLGEYIPGYNKNRALNGIGLKLKTEDECIKYTAELNVALAKAELEYASIKNWRSTIIQLFLQIIRTACQLPITYIIKLRVLSVK